MPAEGDASDDTVGKNDVVPLVLGAGLADAVPVENVDCDSNGECDGVAVEDSKADGEIDEAAERVAPVGDRAAEIEKGREGEGGGDFVTENESVTVAEAEALGDGDASAAVALAQPDAEPAASVALLSAVDSEDTEGGCGEGDGLADIETLAVPLKKADSVAPPDERELTGEWVAGGVGDDSALCEAPKLARGETEGRAEGLSGPLRDGEGVAKAETNADGEGVAERVDSSRVQ